MIPTFSTIQVIIGIGLFIIAVTGLNLVLLLKYLFSVGKFYGEVNSKFSSIELCIKEINKNLDNHIPTQFNQVYSQMREYSKIIDIIDKRLIRVEILLNQGCKED